MKKSHKSQNTLGIGRRKVSAYAEVYPFAREGSLPPGNYISRIDNIEETATKSGAPAIDVDYTLTDGDGEEYRMRARIPLDSNLYDEFADAMLAAGADEDTALDDLIGITENVDVDFNAAGFAEFARRSPWYEESEEGED